MDNVYNNALALSNAVEATIAKSNEVIDTLDRIIERMEERVARWKTEASFVDIYNIIEDIKGGEFCEADTVTTKYYNNDRIAVTAQVDNYYYPISLEVVLIDEEGDEHNLCQEQYDLVYKAWGKALQEAEKEARSEAEHIKQLWRTAYA